MTVALDLNGMVFGKWTIISRIENTKAGQTMWECLCSGCGEKYNVMGSALVSGKSLGCKKCANLDRRKSSIGKVYGKFKIVAVDKSKYTLKCNECGYVKTSKKPREDECSECAMCRRLSVKNVYNLTGDFGIGYTNGGDEFYFDISDYDKIKHISWNVRNGYIFGRDVLNNCKTIKMHTLITGFEIVDHINRCVYDNRRSNLRNTTISLNNRNKSVATNNTSGVTGVSFNHRDNEWYAYIKVGDIRLKEHFKDKDDAIYQRLVWEKEHFKEYAPQKHLFQQYLVCLRVYDYKYS